MLSRSTTILSLLSGLARKVARVFKGWIKSGDDEEISSRTTLYFFRAMYERNMKISFSTAKLESCSYK